jgi:hypothetical protein
MPFIPGTPGTPGWDLHAGNQVKQWLSLTSFTSQITARFV